MPDEIKIIGNWQDNQFIEELPELKLRIQSSCKSYFLLPAMPEKSPEETFISLMKELFAIPETWKIFGIEETLKTFISLMKELFVIPETRKIFEKYGARIVNED